MLVHRLLGDSMRQKEDTLSLQGKLKSPREACLECLSSWRRGEATMRVSHVARREILGNKQATWNAYAHVAHARVGSQVARGCSTDATPHTHAVAMTTHHRHRDVSPGARAHHHRTLGPFGMLRIPARGFHSKYNLLFPLPGQGGDKSKLYF